MSTIGTATETKNLCPERDLHRTKQISDRRELIEHEAMLPVAFRTHLTSQRLSSEGCIRGLQGAKLIFEGFSESAESSTSTTKGSESIEDPNPYVATAGSFRKEAELYFSILQVCWTLSRSRDLREWRTDPVAQDWSLKPLTL